MQEPSIGRIVHVLDREELVEAKEQGREPRPSPAIIRAVRGGDNGAVDLCVFTEFGARNFDNVPFSGVGTGGGWSWPPTVGPNPTQNAKPPKEPVEQTEGEAEGEAPTVRKRKTAAATK